MANNTVVGLFKNYKDSEAAVSELLDKGYDYEDMSIIARKDSMSPYIDKSDHEDRIGDGASTGAAIGGIAGLLAGIAGLTIPGLGPVLAAGTLAATLGATAAGAATGGIVGALADLGISKGDAEVYAEGVKRGGILVYVKAPGDNADQVTDIFEDYNAVDIKETSKTWSYEGWSSFDDSDPDQNYPTL